MSRWDYTPEGLSEEEENVFEQFLNMAERAALRKIERDRKTQRAVDWYEGFLAGQERARVNR